MIYQIVVLRKGERAMKKEQRIKRSLRKLLTIFGNILSDALFGL